MDEVKILTYELLLELDKLTAEQVLSVKEDWEKGMKEQEDYPRVRSLIEEITKVALERKAEVRIA